MGEGGERGLAGVEVEGDVVHGPAAMERWMFAECVSLRPRRAPEGSVFKSSKRNDMGKSVAGRGKTGIADFKISNFRMKRKRIQHRGEEKDKSKLEI